MIEKTKAILHKATIYFVDYACKHESFDDLIELLGNRMLDVDVVPFNVESTQIMWHDEIDINHGDTTQEEYNGHFETRGMTQEQIEEALGYKIEIIE